MGEWKEKERQEESEDCLSVLALWNGSSWDSRILCQDSTLQNQSLSTELKENDTRVHMHVHTHTREHMYIQAVSSVLVRHQQDSM